MTTSKSDERRGWYLERGISPGHILTSITLAVTGAWYIIGMQAQIDQGRAQSRFNLERIIQLQGIIGEGNGPLRRDIDRIQQDVDKINEKLDNINDKLGKPRYLKDYR